MMGGKFDIVLQGDMVVVKVEHQKQGLVASYPLTINETLILINALEGALEQIEHQRLPYDILVNYGGREKNDFSVVKRVTGTQEQAEHHALLEAQRVHGVNAVKQENSQCIFWPTKAGSYLAAKTRRVTVQERGDE